jgi:LacI family transcriptional regulator
VIQAAADLGYRPSKAALGIRLGRFRSVGLVLPDLHNPYYTSFADLLDKALKKEGYDLIIEHSDNTLAQEKHCFDAILDRQVDGAIFFVTDTQVHRPFLEGLAKRKFPAVALAAKPERPLPVDAVLVDFSEGVAEAVNHLVGLGHRRLAFLCALAEGQEDGHRPELFRQLLAKHGIPASHMTFVRCGHDMASARAAFRAMLQQNRTALPSAVIALNDLSAIGAMRAAIDEGVQVPRDLSVIGVDNIPLGEHLPVALSTIAQPIGEMARCAVSLLLKRIDDPVAGKPTQTVFATELLLRESTARAR